MLKIGYLGPHESFTNRKIRYCKQSVPFQAVKFVKVPLTDSRMYPKFYHHPVSSKKNL